MDNEVGMQVINSLNDLCQVIDKNFPFFDSKVHMSIDNSHQLEEISKGTELHDHTNIFGGIDDLL